MPSFWGESAESQEDAEVVENGEHLWSGLLKEVTNKASSKLPSTRALIILGDDESGKTTLIARIQGTEDPKRSFGLEYSFIDIKDEDRDDHTKLNVWILDGDIIHNHLLKFALTAENFGDCIAVVVVNMAEPWNIMKNLEKWTGVLIDHIERTPIDEDLLNEYKEGLIQQFRGYVEPDTMLTPNTPVPVSHAPLPAASLSSRRQPTPALPKQKVHPATAALLSLGSVAPKRQSSVEGDAELRTEKSGNGAPSAAPSASELLLDPSTLSRNLGMPLVVVVTKTDTMNTLQKEERFTEEHFDFVQMHIRRFCLNFGAALFYVSVKEDKNCDLLNRYLRNRMYGFPFTQSAYVVERDCVFIPTGWDSEKKIAILEENLTSIRPTDKYNDIIKPPEPAKKPTIREPEISATDEQSFLTRLITISQRESTAAGAPATNGTTGSSDNLFDQFSNSASPGTRTPVTASPRIGGQSVRGKPSPPGAPTSGSTASGSAASIGLPVGATGSAGRGSENVLANFFTSLLTKRSSATPGGAGSGSSPSHVGLSPGLMPTNSVTEKFAMSPKDIQSELERLARSSQETLDSGIMRESFIPSCESLPMPPKSEANND